MEAFFAEAVRQYGLPFGLLLVAVMILGRAVVVQNREQRATDAKRIAELEIEVKFYRDKWLEELERSEVGAETSERLAVRGRRRPGGAR